ncbi:hypothetical protein [Aquamicrobium sp. LC103]|uniref:hypothetical protein n=1 Tax=Aquamicrobium sp. LC103 TaxID=1120658 RepID=UPI00063E8ABD|nr:hypothetical protein [Aquamicrobium sp. LC103]TKT76936.1 hypothetical protein XW59_015890 [Aquamicrobium sp. LC103]
MTTDFNVQAVRPNFVVRVFYIFLALALLSAAISVAGKWIGRSIVLAGHTEDRTIHEVVIGNDVLAIPANMIRFEASRRDGVASRVDLYLRWPDMDGYTTDARDDFNHAGGSKNIIFMSFEPRLMSRDMGGRYGPIYSSLVEKPGRPGPNGLTVHDFIEQSGYKDEVLVVGDRGGRVPFVARCLSGAAAKESLAPCERDVHIGKGLNLVYRMPAELAAQWREVDPAIMAAARKFLRTAE